MILRCLFILLIATITITQAELASINCEFIKETERGLQCGFKDVLTFQTTQINVVDRNSSVEAVTFHQSELYSVPADIFQKFPQLRHLDVEQTDLKVIKSDNFYNANQLKYFLARFNEISRIESETFSSSPQLKYIVLQQNRISDIHPRAFYGLNHLEILYLDYNRVTALPSNLLDYLPNLLHFSMTYNNLSSIPDNLFIKNEKLETLNLGHNLLTSFDDEQFRRLPNLERVQLDFNNLSQLDLSACKSVEVNIDNNNLSEIQLNKWTKTVSAWENPVKKLVLHEHYGTGRTYNFTFNDVSEIVFFVHEHCCSVENLENFYILTLSFGDLSEKKLNAKNWKCKFRKNIGYETDKGYITNNVCVKDEDQILSLKSRTNVLEESTFESIIVESSTKTISESQTKPSTTEQYKITSTSSMELTISPETTEQSIQYVSHETSSTTQEPALDTDEMLANIEEFTTTESSETATEKGVWKSLKKKVGGLKTSVVSKWNTWVG
ncbi:unnamed protein product [Chironomus riparius]|uniref:Uncharacterized protein n=1 Tax=Chironomus riparius TaxID=315576 RepID=A0A9N9RTC0_9DIPT|nr:unnamed protein product [Chironomus riparius]